MYPTQRPHCFFELTHVLVPLMSLSFIFFSSLPTHHHQWGRCCEVFCVRVDVFFLSIPPFFIILPSFCLFLCPPHHHHTHFMRLGVLFLFVPLMYIVPPPTHTVLHSPLYLVIPMFNIYLNSPFPFVESPDRLQQFPRRPFSLTVPLRSVLLPPWDRFTTL